MYIIDREDKNTFLFSTAQGVYYAVYFRPTPYLLGDETIDYVDCFFELIVQVIDQNNLQKIPLDYKVGDTVAEIIRIFFSENDKTVTLYICDSSDNRQLVRHRKFEQWWLKYASLDLFKIDEVLIDSDGQMLPISLIIRKDNPHKLEIITKFTDILLEYTK